MNDVQAVTTSPQRGFFRLLGGVFISPRDTFTYLRDHGGRAWLLVAAFGIANTMIMSIYERTREIGLMKAVGATNREVMLIFLGEAGAIGMVGGIGGVISGIYPALRAIRLDPIAALRYE